MYLAVGPRRVAAQPAARGCEHFASILFLFPFCPLFFLTYMTQDGEGGVPCPTETYESVIRLCFFAGAESWGPNSTDSRGLVLFFSWPLAEKGEPTKGLARRAGD